VLLFLFLNRRVRVVGPLVLTALFVAISGANYFQLFSAANPASPLYVIVRIGFTLGLGAMGVFVGLLLIGFIAFGLIGWVGQSGG
jgi:hypothetical protein